MLLLVDPVDEIWTTSIPEFQGKKIRSVAKGDVELPATEDSEKSQEERKEKAREYGALLTTIQEKLQEDVKEVRLSNRLRSSAVCLVADENDVTPQFERMLRAMGQEVPKSKRILELNPEHPLLGTMQDILTRNLTDPRLNDYIELLYGQALLSEGAQLPDPGKFSRLVADLMVKAG